MWELSFGEDRSGVLIIPPIWWGLHWSSAIVLASCVDPHWSHAFLGASKPTRPEFLPTHNASTKDFVKCLGATVFNHERPTRAKKKKLIILLFSID